LLAAMPAGTPVPAAGAAVGGGVGPRITSRNMSIAAAAANASLMTIRLGPGTLIELNNDHHTRPRRQSDRSIRFD